MPGWIDNINRPTGAMVGVVKGVLRVVRGHAKLVADIIPLDFVINLMIVVAWYTATQHKYAIAFNYLIIKNNNEKKIKLEIKKFLKIEERN